MLKIFSFPLPVIGVRVVALSKGAQILCVRAEGDSLFLWALVDPQAQHEDRFFASYTRGEQIHELEGVSREYVGTVQLDPDLVVVHIFELKQHNYLS
jgi:hypothetical protein